MNVDDNDINHHVRWLRELVEVLQSEEADPDEFLKLSRKFSLQINFFPSELYRFMKLADRFDMICSMNLFGNTIFSILKNNEINEFYRLFLKNNISGCLLFSSINHSGAKIIDSS